MTRLDPRTLLYPPVAAPRTSQDQIGAGAANAPRQRDTSDGTSLLYGVIAFDDPERHTGRIVIVFESVAAARGFAMAHDLVDYLVAPLSFVAAL